MALILHCDRCKKELDKPGAIIGSPPFGINKWLKFHICVDCWEELKKWLDEKAVEKLVKKKD